MANAFESPSGETLTPTGRTIRVARGMRNQHVGVCLRHAVRAYVGAMRNRSSVARRIGKDNQREAAGRKEQENRTAVAKLKMCHPDPVPSTLQRTATWMARQSSNRRSDAIPCERSRVDHLHRALCDDISRLRIVSSCLSWQFPAPSGVLSNMWWLRSARKLTSRDHPSVWHNGVRVRVWQVWPTMRKRERLASLLLAQTMGLAWSTTAPSFLERAAEQSIDACRYEHAPRGVHPRYIEDYQGILSS